MSAKKTLATVTKFVLILKHRIFAPAILDIYFLQTVILVLVSQNYINVVTVQFLKIQHA